MSAPLLYSQRTRPWRFRLWCLVRSIPCRLGLREHWWVVRHEDIADKLDALARAMAVVE